MSKEIFDPNIAICSNSKREIVRIQKDFYVYIPLNEQEKKLFAEKLINPCWRIKQPNEQGREVTLEQ